MDLTAARQWCSTIEGKIAIYGSIFFAVTSLAGHVAASFITPPQIVAAVASRVQSIRFPCQSKGKRYWVGVSVWVNFEGHDGERKFCRDFKSATWLEAD